MVNVLGVFELVGKLINSTINIEREICLLPNIYGLELELKITF
jgi:hypothetical protein